MKIKWLVALLILYITITLIILSGTKQAIKTNLMPQKEVPETNQASNYLETFPGRVSVATTPLSAVKRNITIINKPSVVEPENKILPPVDNATNQIVLSNPVNTPSSSETENVGNAQPGITKIGKYPTKKETQELNSAGIVMY